MIDAEQPGNPPPAARHERPGRADLLLEHGPLSRTRLGELTGLSKPTASQLLARLEAAGLVRRAAAARGAGPERAAVRDQPRRGVRRRARRHPHADPRRRRRHHRRTVGEFELPHARARRAGHGRRGSCEALDGALPARRLEPRATCTGSSSAPPAPSTRRTRGSATPATCPAGTPLTCSTSWPTRSPCRSRSTTTSTSPPSPSSSVGAAQGCDELRAAVGRGGPRRRPRHRRPAAPRRHRRRRRGRLPAAARHPAGPPRRPATTPAASRSSPAARQVLELARELGIRARGPPRRAVSAGAARRPATGDEFLHELGAPAGDRSRRDRRGARPRAGRPRRRRAHRGRRAAARARPGRARRPGACRARRSRSTGVPERPGPARAPCTRALARTRDEVFDTMPVHRPTAASRDVTPDSGRSKHAQEIAMARSNRIAAASRRSPRRRAARHRLHGQHRGQRERRPQRTRPRSPSGTAGAPPSEVEGDPGRTSTRSRQAHPNIHVKVVGNITDDKINQALRAGGDNAPDVVSSFTTDNVGQVLHLQRLRRPDAVPREVGHRPGEDLPEARCSTTPSSRATGARCRCSATRTASTTTRTPSRRPASPSRPRRCRSSRPTRSS